MVMTDSLPEYKHIGTTRPRLAVNHSAREYARTDMATGQRIHANRVTSLVRQLHAPGSGLRVLLHLREASSTVYWRGDIPLEPEDRLLSRPRDADGSHDDGRLLSCRFLTAKEA